MRDLPSLEVARADEHRGTPAHDNRGRELDIRRRDLEVSSLQSAFMELYQAIEVRRTVAMPLVVQFIGTSERAGATTVASGYARVASVLTSQPVLYVDCGPGPRNPRLTGEPPTLLDASRRAVPLSETVVPARGCENLFWSRLCPVPHALMAFGGDGLNRLMGKLRVEYSLIVLDSSSVDSAVSAALSRYCDGTVLVVAAGRTRDRDIAAARMQIERFGGQTVGVVLNRQRQLLPRWLERRL